MDVDAIHDELDALEAAFTRRLAALRDKLTAVLPVATSPVEDEPVTDELAAPDEPVKPELLADREVSEIRPSSEQLKPAARPRSSESREPARLSPPRPKAGVELIVGQTWLLIGGIVALVIGIGYFLGYSFERNWIGPTGRVLLAYLAGAGLLGAGAVFHRRRLAAFGLSLVGGGIATLYFASFAAFQMYALIPQAMAFAIMVAITAMAGVLAVHTSSKWLAILGLVGGFTTPLMLTTGDANHIALMTYLAILTGGVYYVARRQRWALLNTLAFGFTWLIAIGWFIDHFNVDVLWSSLLFVNLFWLAYVVIPVAYHIDRTDSGPMQQRWMPTLSSLIAFGLTYVMIADYASERYMSVAAVIYGATLVALGAHIYRRSRDTAQAPILVIATGLGFWLAAVPLLLSGHWITVFWSAQTVALVWAATRLGDRRLLAGALWLLATVAGKLVIYDYAVVFGLSIDHLSLSTGFAENLASRLVSAAAVLGALIYCARTLHRALPVERLEIDAPRAVTIAGVVIAFIVLTVEVGALCADYVPAAQLGALSVLWALFAAALCAVGVLRNSSLARRAAMTLFLVTGAKAILIDMQDLHVPFRIMSFIAMGLILIGASYLYHRYRDRITAPLS